MAEHGAHITSSAEGSPSVYEVLAQEGLSSSLRLAFKYAFKVLAQSQPAKFGALYRYGDEVYVIFNTLLETHFLKSYNASFSENFYSLKRVAVCNQKDSRQLPRNSRIKSLMFLVFLPYIRDKLNKLYENLLDKQDRGLFSRPPKTFQEKLERLILRIHPFLHLVWEGMNLALLFAYVIGRSGCHSLALWLCGLRLHNLTMDDVRQQLQMTQPALDLANKSYAGMALSVLTYSGGLLANGATSVLSLAVFFLQFLQCWYSAPLTALTTLPTPRCPPQRAAGDGLPAVPTICPLCNRMRSNDTVLAVSGYVFCYPCIYRYVSQHSRCPITAYPATTDHLVKIYLQGG